MQLFYTPDISGRLHTLSTEESRHCVQVLRLTIGAQIHLIDGRGGLYKAQIIDASPKACVVQVIQHEKEFEKRPYRLQIAIAPTKNIDRTEWFMEKATEIGIDRITPILCEHSERKVIKIDRCDKVVLSAAKQSLKAYVPQIDELTRFADFIRGDFSNRECYIAHCNPSFERAALSDILTLRGDYVVLIGAEGDFSPAEIQQAYQIGFRGISLGTSRLRTETAALVATTIVALRNG